MMEQEGTLEDVLWLNPVGQVYDFGAGVDSKDDALHQARVGVLQAEVRRQRDDGLVGSQCAVPRPASP